ncbi:MAG TPA: hypothetical protein VHR72_15435 [Gemmataceae bacterium]|jgi:hypothetical protein|nr:hypothetical protein [Gemmataceae bacterium]
MRNRDRRILGAMRRAVGCGVAVLLLGAAGCGGSSRVEVSGEVTFGGNPIPAGRIYFTPDTSKGNDGPQGFAEIKDGRFDTRDEGRGAKGGPTIVTVAGNNGAMGNGQGTPLFDEYPIKMDLPTESSTQKFDVPANARKTRKGSAKKM